LFCFFTEVVFLFAELKCKTNFSFLTGASNPEELILRAVELGLRSLAINDNNGVYGLPKAYGKTLELIEKKQIEKFHLITGTELTLGDHAPLTLLCQNKSAYALMCRLITRAHQDQPKGQAKLHWINFTMMMSEPGHDGLIALIDPCTPPAEQPYWRYEYAVLKQLFPGRLYLTLARWFDGFDKERTAKVKEISRKFDIPIIATNDVHYHRPERRILQDIMTANRHLLSLDEAGRKLFSNNERYLKAPSKMYELFKDMPEIVSRTVGIAESCTFSLKELTYQYPTEWIPEGETAQSHLEKLTWQGAQNRYPEGVPEFVNNQISNELKLISQMNFADYFLTVWQIVDFARKEKILCQGRGSAANSVVCYCLGITAVDPVKVNLLFERFIAVERGEPPDIDVDFEHDRREEVIQHIYKKYGRDRAAMVSAVITYKERAAKRDIKRAFGLHPDRPAPIEREEQIEQLSGEFWGFPRHLSIHSGGFILSHEPLTNIVPIEPARMEGRTIIQWDKYDLDILGLLKIDVLSLGMLTAIQKTLLLTGKELYEITRDEDPETYTMIQKGDTIGTFQIESRAQMNMLGRLRPKTFYDLVVQVAIVRPGPIVGKMVHPYLKRRNGLEKADYPHPLLKPILEKTMGVPIFQEQVMKMAIVLADFTPGEADRLRRAIGAWRSNGTIEEMGRKLMNGLLAKGLPKEWVERVFEQIKGFAEYGFPESHAASFALLAYASAYLKCHHPAEFTCSLINSQPMGFYSTHTLLDDAKRAGVKILPIDFNVSEWDCTIENGALRLGFRVVKGIRKTEIDDVLCERHLRPFASMRDVLARVNLQRRVLYNFALGDVFKPFGLEQRQALWSLLAEEALLNEESREQLNIFKQMRVDEIQRPQKNQVAEGDKDYYQFATLGDYEAISADYESFGLSLKGHPMEILRKTCKQMSSETTAQIKQKYKHGNIIKASGLVIARQRPPTAKGTVFATLEDESGLLDLILHKKTFEKYEELLLTAAFLSAEGEIQQEGWSVSLLVRSLWSPLPADEKLRKRVRAYGSYFG
jgi:error-prone DNA polymerase